MKEKDSLPNMLVDGLVNVFSKLPFPLKFDEDKGFFGGDSGYLSATVYSFFSIASSDSAVKNDHYLHKKISSVSHIFEYIEFILKIERTTYKYINAILGEIDVGKNFIELGSHTENIKKCLQVLYESNKFLLENSEQILNLFSQYDAELYEKIVFIRNKIICSNEISGKKLIMEINPKIFSGTDAEVIFNECDKNTMIFLNKVKNFIVISLLKANYCSAGQSLIQNLYNVLSKDNLFEVVVNYTGKPGTLITQPTDGLCYAKLSKQNPDKTAEIKDRLESITKNTGSGSVLHIPICYDSPSDDIAIYGGTKIIAVYFQSEESINNGLSKVISGSFSFGENEKLFYIPAHIEYLHEIIHIIDNAEGNNTALLDILTDEEKHIWKDASEYLVVEGRETCENAFNQFFGLPKNMGHGGFSAVLVLTPELNDQPQESIKSFNLG